MGLINLKIFFDESGKKGDKTNEDKNEHKISNPLLMGALSIPDDIYDLNNIKDLNNKLKQNEISYHFTKYNGNNKKKEEIKNLIKIFKSYYKIMRFNVIKYKNPAKSEISNNFMEMVYSKFPERLFYGLLRCKGESSKIHADIFMEESTEYKELLPKVKTQLNIQATYRGEKYTINNCDLLSKNQEIGIELTDMFLGIIRIIIMNENVNEINSKTKSSKIKLINEILQEDEFYNFLVNIRYYEWDNSQYLKEVNFKEYLDFYIAKNFKEIYLIEEQNKEL